jgi:hypothetical protein
MGDVEVGNGTEEVPGGALGDMAGQVAGTDYEARCRWTSEDDEDGEWSDWTPFTTLAPGGAQVKLAIPVDLGNPTLDHYYILCDGKFT